MDKPGYNLFVTGLTGTGKTSAIKAHLQSIAAELNGKDQQKPISDWAYIYNFEDTDRPSALRLSPGTTKTLRNRMSGMLRMLGEDIPKVFKSEEYEAQRRNLEDTERQKTRQVMSELEEAAGKSHFAVQVLPTGVTIFPMLDDRTMSPEEYMALDSAAKKSRRRYQKPIYAADPGGNVQHTGDRKMDIRQVQGPGAGSRQRTGFRHLQGLGG